MKKYLALFSIIIFSNAAFTQTITHHIRYDTTTLNAEECEWVIKGLTKNVHPLTNQIGKSVPEVIISYIKKGIIKAYDPLTNKLITPKQISTWGMVKVLVPLYDSNGNQMGTKEMQQEMNPVALSKIKIYHEWFINPSTGKISDVIKWVDLMSEVVTSSGITLGNSSWCRIYY